MTETDPTTAAGRVRAYLAAVDDLRQRHPQAFAPWQDGSIARFSNGDGTFHLLMGDDVAALAAEDQPPQADQAVADAAAILAQIARCAQAQNLGGTIGRLFENGTSSRAFAATMSRGALQLGRLVGVPSWSDLLTDAATQAAGAPDGRLRERLVETAAVALSWIHTLDGAGGHDRG